MFEALKAPSHIPTENARNTIRLMSYPEPIGNPVAPTGYPDQVKLPYRAPVHAGSQPAPALGPFSVPESSPVPPPPTSVAFPAPAPSIIPAPAPAPTLAPAPVHLTQVPKAPASKPRASRGAIAAIVLLSLLTTAALALGTYFWLAADRWQANSAAWEDQARAQGVSVAEVQEQLAAAQAETSALQQHLDSAQARITELANERAQLGDQQVVDQNRIDFQQRLSAAAGQVASSLDLCIARQDELIDALRNPGRFTEDSVARFGEQVVQFCAEARTANANLQAEINR